MTLNKTKNTTYCNLHKVKNSQKFKFYHIQMYKQTVNLFKKKATNDYHKSDQLQITSRTVGEGCNSQNILKKFLHCWEYSIS